MPLVNVFNFPIKLIFYPLTSMCIFISTDRGSAVGRVSAPGSIPGRDIPKSMKRSSFIKVVLVAPPLGIQIFK